MLTIRGVTVFALFLALGCTARESRRETLSIADRDYLEAWAGRLPGIWLSLPCERHSLDSLLRARGTSLPELEELIDRCNANPENFYPYLYQAAVESISTIEVPDPSCLQPPAHATGNVTSQGTATEEGP
ncbi:hypothetical protein JW921_01985 [Candidatus Fermentibacterales bacterium]|nr:hypothetical protein [Candidatus Fermentibacterales bacterium]